MTTREDHIDWRHAKILELSSQGYSEREIATRLQVSKTTIHQDLAHIRRQAQESLKHHLHEVVPEEYLKCMVGIKRNLKQTLEIRHTASDPKIRLQAAAIANDCYKFILDMTTNAGVISDALKFVERKNEQLDTLKKIDDRIEEIEEEKTTNGIF